MVDAVVFQVPRNYERQVARRLNAKRMQDIAFGGGVVCRLVDPLIDHVEKFFPLIERELKRHAVGLPAIAIVDESSQR